MPSQDPEPYNPILSPGCAAIVLQAAVPRAAGSGACIFFTVLDLDQTFCP